MIVHDSPSSHPTISESEKSFIETSIRGSDDKAEVSEQFNGLDIMNFRFAGNIQQRE